MCYINKLALPCLVKYPNDFWHKRKVDNFDPDNVLLAIAKNIPEQLMTGFVVQGHIKYLFYIV